VFNSWADMPPVSEQLVLEGSRTNQNLCAARFLLKPGRKYQEAVDLFEPYDKTKEPDADARAAGAALVKEGVEAGRNKKDLHLREQSAGRNALDTVAAILEHALSKGTD